MPALSQSEVERVAAYARIGQALWARIRLLAVAHVKIAVWRGDLKPPTDYACVDCDRPAKVYEHRDYARYLDVVPTCARCNIRRGAAALNIHAWLAEHVRLPSTAGAARPGSATANARRKRHESR